MAKSPDEMAATMIDNLPDKTGRSLSEWLEILKLKNFGKHGEIVQFLKKEHGVTHGFANLIAHKSKENVTTDAPDPESDLVKPQYAGPKSGLKPIYDRIIAEVLSFGPDVEISPKKTYVSLRRSKQFALIQPSTKSRVDLGINLKNVEPVGKLEKSGSFNAMVSHRVRLESEADFTDEVKKWLKEAYQQA